MINGLSDVEEAGNPSLRKTLIHLSEFGYSLRVFTAMPQDYLNLLQSMPWTDRDIRFRRLPGLFSAAVRGGKRLKDVLGRRRPKGERTASNDEGQGTYLREYSPMGRLLYIAFLFLFYLPMELLRTWIFSLKWKPDLVYGVNCQGAVVASALGRILGTPVITRFHGVSVSRQDLGHWLRRLLLLDEMAGLRAGSDAVIVTNDGTDGKRILQMLNVPEGRIRYWMNGVDIKRSPLAQGRSREVLDRELGVDRGPVLLMVSRLAPWKRVDRGIVCLKALIHNGFPDAVLLIAGDGPKRDDLQSLVGDLGLTASVKFLGPVPYDRMARYYAAADVFLSLYDVSNLANPVLEAMSFGLPIVSLDDGSTGGLLISGENCLLCALGEIDQELPGKVRKILEDDAFARRIGANARRTFEEKVLSWRERMRLEDALIREVLSRRD
jgi:glycosyltransferase involved in cell wall biosynthesis